MKFIDSNRSGEAVSKNTYYRFLNVSTYNWKRFLLLLATKVIVAFNRLTRPERINVLILDDSVVPRNRSKSVELLAKIFDHAGRRYQRGFTMLTLGWSDGYSFVPTGFTLLSSSKKDNRYQEINDDIDKGVWLAELSTDLTISDREIIRIYGNRWSIECFFKSAKSFMKLGSEFLGRSYDMMISHTTIVFCRYIILEWLRREKKDTKTFGELFFRYCEDIQDMDYVNALQSLMDLFVEQIETAVKNGTNMIKSQLQYWIAQQASYIQALFADLSCRVSKGNFTPSFSQNRT